MKEKNKGLLLVFLGAVAFSLGGLLVKLIPWSAISTNGGRCIFSSMVIGLYMFLSKKKLIINKTVIAGAICVFLMLLCYVGGNKLTTAANTIVLEYTAPIFIIIFEAILFNRKATKLEIITCLFVFVGIIFVVKDGLGKGKLIGDLVGLLSGVFYAITIMLNDFKDGDSLSSVLLGHILTAIVGIPFIMSESDFSVKVLLLVSALGIFQAGMGYTLLAVGLKKCDPISGSLIASIEPVLNPILVAIFYGEYMSVSSIIGAFIVIGTIVIYNLITINNNA